VTRALPNPQAPWSAEKAGRRVYTRDGGVGDDAVRRLIADCHPKQRDAATDPSALVSACIPRGGGKTTTFMVRAIDTLTSRPEAYVPYIATTKGHATNILWRKVKRAMEAVQIEYRPYEVDKMIVLTKNGAILKLAGADDDAEVDKLRGFRIDGLGIDEAAYHSAKRLAYIIDEAVGPRLRGWVFLIGSPGRDPSGLFYDVTVPGGPLHRPYADRDAPEYADWSGWSSHAWTLKEASAWAQAQGPRLADSELTGAWAEAQRKKAANQWGDDNPKWRREYLGEWAKDDTNNMYKYRATLTGEDAVTAKVKDGADWNRWDPPRVGPLQVAKLPADRADWLWVISLDRGHADEFAINGFAFSPTDPLKRIFHVLCYERKRLYARQVACLLLGTREKASPDRVIAANDDASAPEPCDPNTPEALSPYGLLGWPIGGVCDSDMTLIDELQKVYGIRCVQAKRQREEKHGAIELLNGDLVDGRFKAMKDSPLEAQMLSLQWLTDEFGQLREPKGKPDHSADTACYGRKLIAHLFESGAVGAKPPPTSTPATRGSSRPDAGPPPAAAQPEWMAALADPPDQEDSW